MFKRFVSFQRMLFNSMGMPTESGKKVAGTYILLALVFFITVSKGFDFTVTLVAAVSFFMVYNSLTSNKKIYELVPVSTKYALINIYLFQPIAMIFTYFLYFVVSMLFVGVILLVVWAVGGNLEQTGPGGSPIVENIISSEGVVFALLLYLLIWFVGTAIALIKKDRIRIGALMGGIAVFAAGIEVLDRTLPQVGEIGATNFLYRFSEASHASSVLLLMGLLVIIVVPISIRVSQRLYST